MVHELPIQLSKDSVLVDLDDSVAVLLDDRFVHFVNFSEYPQRNVTQLQRRHYKTRRSHYPVVGFGGFNFGNESESERQIVVFYSLECYHSHLTEDGPYRIFKTFLPNKEESLGTHPTSCSSLT